MSAADARHPSDEDRARETAPLVAEAAAALAAGDRVRLLAVLREDVTWIGPAGARTGPAEATAAMLASVAGAHAWRPPVQVGATAVLGFSVAGSPRVVVLTVRRDGVVIAAGAAD